MCVYIYTNICVCLRLNYGKTPQLTPHAISRRVCVLAHVRTFGAEILCVRVSVLREKCAIGVDTVHPKDIIIYLYSNRNSALSLLCRFQTYRWFSATQPPSTEKSRFHTRARARALAMQVDTCTYIYIYINLYTGSRRARESVPSPGVIARADCRGIIIILLLLLRRRATGRPTYTYCHCGWSVLPSSRGPRLDLI